MILNTPSFHPLMELIDCKLNPYAVYIFGSSIRDTWRDDSDVDIAFLSDEQLSTYNVFMIAQEAASLINRDVDLINLNVAETVFAAQIISTGQIVLNRRLTTVSQFHIRTLKEYALLNEERSCILNEIASRGSLYDK